jgi:hypothetical protein
MMRSARGQTADSSSLLHLRPWILSFDALRARGGAGLGVLIGVAC